MTTNVDQRSFAIGDVITLESSNGTFLAADVYGTVYFDISQGNQKTPEQFERCKWIVCGRLAYSDAELKKALGERKRSSSMGEAEQKMISDQAEKEVERNEEDIKKTKGAALLYGQIIQLKHAATGHFLASKNSSAKTDKNCLALYLHEGASNAYFRISPRYKVRTEGGQILFNDEIVLGSVATAGFYVHESKIPAVAGQQPAVAKGGYVYSEANLSRELTECGLSADLCARFSVEDEAYLRTDKAIRFWLPDSEAFIQAPCECQKTSKTHPVVVGNRLFNIPSPTHASAFSASSAWSLELVDRRKEVLVEWNKQAYRLFHRASRKYLTINKDGEWRCGNQREPYPWNLPVHKVSADANSAEVLDQEDIEVKFSLSLEEGRDDMPELLERQTFQLDFVDRATKHIPREDVLVVVKHTLANGTKFYVHGDKKSEDEDMDVEGGEVQSVSLSSVLRTYDAMILLSVPDEYAAMIEFATNSRPVIASHTHFIDKEGGSEDGALSDAYAT